jgi:hypothetical protein
MHRLFVFVCALCALLPGTASAQTTPIRSAAQIADSLEIASLARSLTDGAATDSARAAALYEWVARNVAYDVNGFLAGRLADGPPESVYRRRIAVCGGYVALFERLAREVGLSAEPILGYAKGFDYTHGVATRRPNHAWLAVRVDGRWRLIDPTWGAGFVAAGEFEPHFTWDYFLVDADELALSHFPEESRWQLLPRPLRRSEFERMPAVPHTLVKAGFEPTAIRALALSSGLRDFPLVGTQSDVRIISAPLTGTLARASRVSVDIHWPGAADVALVSGGVWTHLTREGDRFRGEVAALESAVSLVGRSGSGKQFETLLHYLVQ